MELHVVLQPTIRGRYIPVAAPLFGGALRLTSIYSHCGGQMEPFHQPLSLVRINVCLELSMYFLPVKPHFDFFVWLFYVIVHDHSR